ncbi:MAG: hypothetical protein AAGA65_20235 [Actinomycetota bacterium]
MHASLTQHLEATNAVSRWDHQSSVRSLNYDLVVTLGGIGLGQCAYPSTLVVPIPGG